MLAGLGEPVLTEVVAVIRHELRINEGQAGSGSKDVVLVNAFFDFVVLDPPPPQFVSVTPLGEQYVSFLEAQGFDFIFISENQFDSS